MSDFTF